MARGRLVLFDCHSTRTRRRMPRGSRAELSLKRNVLAKDLSAGS